jgi:hypothetical protein
LPSVAVLEPSSDSSVNKPTKSNIRGVIEDALKKGRKYRLIDRQTSKLLSLEKAYLQGDTASLDAAIEAAVPIGKRLGADYVCVSEMSGGGGRARMSIALVHVQTGVKYARSSPMAAGGRGTQMVAEDLVGKVLADASAPTARPRHEPARTEPQVLSGFVQHTDIKYEVRLMGDGSVRLRFDTLGIGTSWGAYATINWELDGASNVGFAEAVAVGNPRGTTTVFGQKTTDIWLKIIDPRLPVRLGNFVAGTR